MKPDGSDAGAFVEVIENTNVASEIPKCSYVDLNKNTSIYFCRHWFMNEEKKITFQLIYGHKKDLSGSTDGQARGDENIGVVFLGEGLSKQENDETAVHEVGHLLNLHKTFPNHVDKETFVKNIHEQGTCIMTYLLNPNTFTYGDDHGFCAHCLKFIRNAQLPY